MDVLNKGVGPVEVFCGGKRVQIAPGETHSSDDFTAQEEAFVRAYPSAFGVSGSGTIEETGDNAELEALRKSHVTLSDIVALFGTDEVDEMNVKAAVERLIQDSQKFDHDGDGKAGGSKSDLAEAVRLLDDENGEHWTQAGKPRLSVLTEFMGSDVTAADYDALPDDQKRERVKPT